MHRILILAIIAAPGLFAGRLSAADHPEKLVRASLKVEQPRSGESFMVALIFEIAEGWHLYWINPGDSGLPLDVQWTLPDGLTPGPVEYPTPGKFESGGIIGFGFEREVALLTRMTPAPEFDVSKPFVLTARLDWLVCKESCVPGSATVSASVNLHDTSGHFLTESHLDGIRASMPRRSLEDSGIRLSRARWTSGATAQQVTLSFEGRHLSRLRDFFPEPIPDFTINHRGMTINGGTVTIPLTPSEASAELTRIRGIALIDGIGYQCAIAVTRL